MQVPNDIFFSLVEECLREKEDVTILVRGTSMRPFLVGDRDCVKLVKPGKLKVGDAVLARLSPGNFVLHRITSMDGSLLTLQGDGLTQKTEQCSTESVMAKVSEYIHPRRTVRAESQYMKTAVKLWMLAKPLRRPLLYAYRKLEAHGSLPDPDQKRS